MLKIKIKADEAHLTLDKVLGRLGDMRPFFVNFWAYMQSRTQLMFQRNAKGGSFRGKKWPQFADQYIRKTDGVTVPAHGGVARLHGAGKVKGRLRGKGKAEKDRVTSSSNLLRHRGILYRMALTKTEKTTKRLVMDTPVDYAASQNAMRPFQFFELPKDGQMAARMAAKYIT